MRCLAGRCVLGHVSVLACSPAAGRSFIYCVRACVCVCVCVLSVLILSIVEDDDWLRMCRGIHVSSGVINHFISIR